MSDVARRDRMPGDETWILSPPTMLSCMNDVVLMSYAAVTMRHHPSKDTQTLVACVRHLQDSHERWTVPTIMCDGRRVASGARLLRT